MRFDDAHQLVTRLARGLRREVALAEARSLEVGAARGMRDARPRAPLLGLGVVPGPRAESRVAVRAWHERDLRMDSSVARALSRLPESEVSVRVTGPIRAPRAAASGRLRRRARPVQPGYSVGHYKVTAGAIGTVK